MNTTKILSTITLMLQVLAVLISFGIIAMQKTITDNFFSTVKYDKMIYPSSFAFMIISLVMYIVFFNISHNGISPNKKTIAVILVILSVILNLLSMPANSISNIYYSRLGVDALAMHSFVSSYLNFPAGLFAGPATAIFYFACGRYAAADIPAEHVADDDVYAGQPDSFN